MREIPFDEYFVTQNLGGIPYYCDMRVNYTATISLRYAFLFLQIPIEIGGGEHRELIERSTTRIEIRKE